MQTVDVKTYEYGGLFVGRTDNGGIACVEDCAKLSSILPHYVRFPFETEYSLVRDGAESFGDTGNFALERTEETEDSYTAYYISSDCSVRVTVRQTFWGGVMRASSEATNLGRGKLTVKKLSNFFGGIACDCLNCGFTGYSEQVKLGIVRGEWGGEGQFEWVTPQTLGLFRATGHRTSCAGEIASAAAYTTRKFAPILFLQNRQGKTWAVQHLPDGPYSMEIGLADAEHLDGSMYTVGCGAGSSEKQGFRLGLSLGESYRTAETALTCADSFEGAASRLTAFRRKFLRRHRQIPLMFNDYMNCLWTKLSDKACLPLLDAAQSAGAEGYCFDDGWYRDADAHGAAHLGDWIPTDSRFGEKGFSGMIQEIRSRGMAAGLWTELEVCSAVSDAAKLPKSFFLKNDGVRIFRCGRFYFNLSNREACRYLFEKVGALYGMGIRYIKNDYNGHPGCGVDWKNASPYAGLEQHCRAVSKFYASLHRKFPDLYIENCASGAMRADGKTLMNFNVQSVSDCEEYEKMPSIINGTLLCLLPEQVGVWAYPYPRIFWEMNGEEYFTKEYENSMADGEQTAFNMVSGFMGTMYLSGKIDRADEKNRALISEACALYKQRRDFISKSVPVFPLGLGKIDGSGFYAQGLKKGREILLAVWRRGGSESSAVLPFEDVRRVKLLYPSNGRAAVSAGKDGVRVTLPAPVSAVLIRMILGERR